MVLVLVVCFVSHTHINCTMPLYEEEIDEEEDFESFGGVSRISPFMTFFRKTN